MDERPKPPAAAMSDVVEMFARNAELAGFTVHRGVSPDLPDAGVSEASWGIAETGSVVLEASVDEPRSRSLLPWVHVSVLREDRVVADLDELLARVRGELPSALAIVTGPSRTADIEQTLMVGVHGPGEVHVVLLPAR
jgi:L-lactate dehydrogenase complex protein LldG